MKRSLLVTVAATLLGASALALAAHAAETEYKFTACGHLKSALLTAGPDLTVYTFEAWFTPTPDNPTKALQGATYHCVGYARVMKGDPERHGLLPVDGRRRRHIYRRVQGGSRHRPDVGLPFRCRQMERDQRRRNLQIFVDEQARRGRHGGGLLGRNRQVDAAVTVTTSSSSRRRC